MMCEEVSFLSVPFRSKHFDAFLAFSVDFYVIMYMLRTYTPYLGYNKFEWLTLPPLRGLGVGPIAHH